MTQRYWSLERCGWDVRDPAGALVTPWSGRELPVPAGPYAASAGELLRVAAPPVRVPGPRSQLTVALA